MLVLSYIWNDKPLRYLLLASLAIVIFMIVFVSTSSAADPCGFLLSSPDENQSTYYINTKEISHLVSTIDTTINTGTLGRYVLIVVMNNGSSIEYGRYRADSSRENAIRYVISAVYKCNRATR